MTSVNEFNQARMEIEKSSFKFWFLEEFDDDKSSTSIMSEIPNIIEYNRRKSNIENEITKVAPELRQFYIEPLLTKEQEFHLFRKMNYLKYKAFRYYNWYCRSNLNRNKKLFLECFAESQRVRNHIVCCNTRLAAPVYKKRKDYYGDDVDNLLSDCFANIIKAIDGFDFRKGFKFSTYCTWVLMNNSLRDHQADKKFQETFSSNVDDVGINQKIDEKSLDQETQREKSEAMASDIFKIFTTLAQRDEREAAVLAEYFGIHDGKKKTLKEISEKMDITKERVRQIKNNALDYLQVLAKSGKLDLQSFEYFC